MANLVGITVARNRLQVRDIRKQGLDIVCYRYNPGKMDLDQLNGINCEILLRLQEEGVVLPSGTTLDGVYCIRVAIVNHRSCLEDFELLVGETLRVGDELVV